MRILGVQSFHDSSVAVINDGEIELFYKEERYTRIKRDFNPYKSIIKCIENLDGPIDYVTIDSSHELGNSPIPNFLNKFIDAPTYNYNRLHHLSHASLAFYNSGFDECLVFVIDREGSNINGFKECETVFHASYPCEFKTLHKNMWLYNRGFDHDSHINKSSAEMSQQYSINADSTLGIASLYESANTLIGQNQFESGKTMGLSSYGKDKPFISLFPNGRPMDNLFTIDTFPLNGNTFVGKSTLLKEHVGKTVMSVPEDNYQFYADYAYQVQKQSQQQVLSMVSEWVEKTGITKVCMTGGFCMNVVCNEFLVKHLPQVQFYFEPIADDTGNSIGSALHLYHQLSNDTTIRKQKHVFVHGDIENITPSGKTCDVAEVAKMLSDGKIVAVFNGKAEAGQRALGNRSILFDARNPRAKEIVNGVKKREWYRPFAGVILKDYFTEYFETHGLSESPFMTLSFPCKSDNIPGVVHVDNTTRVQTVDDSIPHLNDLLNEFYSLTDVPVLLNTSFNLAGQPLVETYDEALYTFEQTNIDAIWFPSHNTIKIKDYGY